MNKHALSKWELKVNWRKTKLMRVARKCEECKVKIREEVYHRRGRCTEVFGCDNH